MGVKVPFQGFFLRKGRQNIVRTTPRKVLAKDEGGVYVLVQCALWILKQSLMSLLFFDKMLVPRRRSAQNEIDVCFHVRLGQL